MQLTTRQQMILYAVELKNLIKEEQLQQEPNYDAIHVFKQELARVNMWIDNGQPQGPACRPCQATVKPLPTALERNIKHPKHWGAIGAN